MNNTSFSEEKRRHSSRLVPYSYYKCLIPDFFANVPLHWHSEIEMNFIIDGSAEFICGDDKFISNEGDIIIVPPNMLHAISPIENRKQRYDTIVFSPDMLGADRNDRCAAECIRPMVTGGSVRITKNHIYYDELKTTAENIFSCAKGNSAQLDMLMKSELLRLFWLLDNNGDIIHSKDTQNSRIEIIRPAIEYINENFRENITIDKLAQTVHLSKSYFMCLFKATVGVGAIEYITQLRIKEACELLESINSTSAQTAFECGFRNLSNFNRQFKKIVGCTPGEYRRICREHFLKI